MGQAAAGGDCEILGNAPGALRYLDRSRKRPEGGFVKFTITEAAPPEDSAITRNRWHAVAVVPGDSACAAAHACENKRFLSVDAPRLPLAECDAAVCDCTYRHFADRRQGPRRADGETEEAATSGKERRHSRGRRAND